MGGVVAAGETPAEAAVRELAEEVGITGVEPRPLLVAWFRDDEAWYLAHVYDIVWDGAVSSPDGEVEAAWWEPLESLRARLADPGWPFVPDTRALLGLLGITGSARPGPTGAGPA